MVIHPENATQDTATSSVVLVSAVQNLLRPLVKVLLARSISYPFMSNLLKTVYVEVACEEFKLQGKPQTDSRISVLSGVHRKDVKRIRSETPEEQVAPPAVSLFSRLVKLWTTDPKRLDETGRHRPLARLKSEGGAESFEALVSSVSKDVRSRVILDEWLRTGVAYLDGNGRVCLNTDAFLSRGGFDDKAYYFGQNLHDHLSAAAHNLLGEQPPVLERAVQYGKLTEKSAAELSELAQRMGLHALDVIGKRASELEAQDKDQPDARQRVSFGVYYFCDDKQTKERP